MAKKQNLLPVLLRLPTAERARLAAELVQSLNDGADSDANSGWLDEISRRAREIASPEFRLQEWESVRRRIESRYR